MAGLEIWGPKGGRRIVELVDERYVVGKADDADVELTDDTTVSAAHAMVQRIGQRWYVHDLNSRNGTTVNKERIIGEQRAAATATSSCSARPGSCSSPSRPVTTRPPTSSRQHPG